MGCRCVGGFSRCNFKNQSEVRSAWDIPAAALAFACAVGMMLGVSGCRSAAVPPPAQRADYTQTLNKYYEGRPMCLWDDPVKFPLENIAGERADDLGLDEFADAGLLRGNGRHGRGLRTYALNAEGKRAFNKDIFTPARAISATAEGQWSASTRPGETAVRRSLSTFNTR